MYYYLFNYGVPVLTFIKSFYNYLKNEVFEITKIDKIVFFENNPTGYLECFISENHKLNGVVVWKYSRSRKLFYQYKCLKNDTKHLPILSATLKCEDEIINLDDFINDIEIEASNIGFPTLQQVLEVWSIETGIVVDRTKPWKLNFMDSNLDEFCLDLFNETWSFEKKFDKKHKN